MDDKYNKYQISYYLYFLKESLFIHLKNDQLSEIMQIVIKRIMSKYSIHLYV